ncbi:putative peptide ABC transporter DppA [Sphaerisporangium krabiense]|uniref:ABC-type oligopeptide transport system substrate-binding subunit n=1 Tax=Sphaerisporangium krabiense TaxID=763782 RepID=A0A7W8Z3Z8_9ACTN|nr:ABC transporter substrate-binding protein [Sphaerisporangium krabiense]MBB5627004.1 ABC-type oligopeptide transport system substrate-binding subunit [Sphaerisporangium krabiense]GII65156.1 putative peptide ABC transporter DppA [Sphaerisporangium krabiense]
MRVTKGAQIVTATALLALAVAACGGSGDTSSSSSGSAAAGNASAVRVEIAEPQHDLIPGNTTETSGAEVLNALFVGLVDYDADKKPFNRIAESIESTDSTTWTIKLKDGYKWHNGEPVVAQNFVDSWNYTANGANAQEGNYFFGSIAGYDELNPGEGKTPSATTLTGLKVVDDKTFTVQLKNPFSGFPTMLGYTAFSPLPKAAFESEGKLKADFGSNPIGNGPFKISKPWKRGTDQTISTVRNEEFKEGKAKVEAVDFKIYTDLATAFNDLRAGNLDIMDQLPAEAIATAKQEFGDRYIEQPSSGIGYIGFPVVSGADYAKNADIRKAISMAIDRKTITETVFSGTRVPADDFISPVVAGYRQGACGEACTYDPAKAKALFQQAGGDKMSEIVIGYNGDGGHKEWIEAIANNLRTNLGAKVTPKPVEKFATILDDLGAKKWTGSFRMAWIMDYPSPENYLRPQFGSGGSSNYSGFKSKEFDDLLTKADAAKTLDEGVKYYQQADDLVLKELPYIPVYFYQTNGAYSQHVKNVKIDPFERIDLFNVEKA